MNILTRSTLLLIILLSLAPSARADDTYKIVLDRPDRVGDVFHTKASTQSSKTTTISPTGGVPVTTTQTDPDAHLEAVFTVVAVDAASHFATAYSIKVEKFTEDGNDVAPAGSVIRADASSGTRKYEIDGKPVTNSRLVTELGYLITPYRPGSPTANQLEGTDNPQRVGDSWPLNREVAAKDMANPSYQVLPSEFQGDSTLSEVSTTDGVAMETIIVHFLWSADQKTTPTGTLLLHPRQESKATITEPVDPSKSGGSGRLDIKTTVEADTAQGHVVIALERHTTIESSPLTPTADPRPSATPP